MDREGRMRGLRGCQCSQNSVRAAGDVVWWLKGGNLEVCLDWMYCTVCTLVTMVKFLLIFLLLLLIHHHHHLLIPILLLIHILLPLLLLPSCW